MNEDGVRCDRNFSRDTQKKSVELVGHTTRTLPNASAVSKPQGKESNSAVACWHVGYRIKPRWKKIDEHLDCLTSD